MRSAIHFKRVQQFALWRCSKFRREEYNSKPDAPLFAFPTVTLLIITGQIVSES